MTGRIFYLWQTPVFNVRLALDVVDRINRVLADARVNRTEEQGGILLGRAMGPHGAEITGFEYFRSEHRRGVAYDMGLRERQRLTGYVRRLRRRKGEAPIGFFRTHYRPGLFLGQDDFSLMTEAFGDQSCNALLIDSGGNAGFFFWEGDDMDRTRPRLVFPFASSKLLEAGPIMTIPAGHSVGLRHRIPAWKAWVMAAAAALAGFAIVSASTHASASDMPKIEVHRK